MRELSAQEQAFLELNLPEGHSSADSSPALRRRQQVGSSIGSRLLSTLGGLLSYLPLAIGIGTLAVAGLATYLYIWGRDFFKVSDVERLSADGTLKLMDSTSGSWFTGTIQIFEIAPWIILGTVVVGILLMGLSMLLLRKRKDG